MTITLGALVNAEPALDRLLAQPVSVKLAYHLAKLAKLVRAETELYHAQRIASVKALGVERSVTPEEAAQGMSGTVFAVLPENLTAFSERIGELTALPITINAWLLTPTLLEDLKVSGADILALGDLVAEG